MSSELQWEPEWHFNIETVEQLLVACKAVPSLTGARRLIMQGAVKIDGATVDSLGIRPRDMMHGNSAILRYGKKELTFYKSPRAVGVALEEMTNVE